MAVRRPHGDAVGGTTTIDSTDRPDERATSRGAWARVTATAALLLVVVVALVVLGLRYAQDTAEGDSVIDRAGQVFAGAPADTEQDDREQVMSVASQFILRVNSYGPSDLDADLKMPGYAEAVRGYITPKFQETFDSSVTLAEQSVSSAGVGRTAQLFSSGVDTIDDDRATVLVAGSFTNSYPDPDRPKKRVAAAALPFRLSVSLVKVDGDWLVDDFAPVESEDDDEGDGATSGQPTTQPTTRPTGSNGNGGGGR